MLAIILIGSTIPVPTWVTPNSSTGRGTTNPDVNVIIWSWCGQASGYTQQDMIDKYLAPMTQLEADYPGIKFVYMTGHLDGGGSAGNLNLRNQQIRDYCTANNKILFDFADIESYDPDGTTNYMLLNANDGCDYDGGYNWADQTGLRQIRSMQLDIPWQRPICSDDMLCSQQGIELCLEGPCRLVVMGKACRLEYLIV